MAMATEANTLQLLAITEYQYKAQIHKCTSLILEDEGCTIPPDNRRAITKRHNATYKRT